MLSFGQERHAPVPRTAEVLGLPSTCTRNPVQDGREVVSSPGNLNRTGAGALSACACFGDGQAAIKIIIIRRNNI